MNFLTLIKLGFAALQQGRSLANPATWKNAQALTSLGTALVAILNVFVPGLHITGDVVSSVAIAIAGLANWYLTYATSKKVGFASDALPSIELVSTPTTGRVQQPPLSSDAGVQSDDSGHNG